MTTLTPVLELEPGTFATKSHDLPRGSGAENPAGWDRYWRDSLADSGITDLTPWRLGSWLVPLSQFSASPTLRIVLRHELEEVTDWEEDVGPLCGGYVLTHGDDVITPGCCGDLSNFADWVGAADCTEGTWQQLWIGHPWTHVRAEGDTLHLAEPSEEADTDRLREAFALPRSALVAAIEDAQVERVRFRTALAAVVAEHEPPIPVDAVVGLLMEGHD